MPHLMFTLLVAALLATAMALIGSRTLPERIAAALYQLLCCVVTVLAGSWIMYWIHG
jgi:hypothetical protein